MTDDAGRPQDQGRRHRRVGQPSAATASLLTRYQESMRDELRGLLDEIAGQPAPAGLLDAGKPGPVVRPQLTDRIRLWDLAIKLGRELGTEVDAGPLVAQAPKPRRPRRVDFG
jgi:hypothetical protein